MREVPDRIEIEADVRGVGGYLLLSDTFDPGWTTTVDGQPAAVEPANIAFRAVYLPNGSHAVVMTYRPVGFLAGLALSVAGLVGAIAMVTFGGRGVRTASEHGGVARGKLLPIGMIVAVGVILAASVFRVDTSGRVSVQARWRESFHPFTWGAKIEAIKPPPPPME